MAVMSGCWVQGRLRARTSGPGAGWPDRRGGPGAGAAHGVGGGPRRRPLPGGGGQSWRQPEWWTSSFGSECGAADRSQVAACLNSPVYESGVRRLWTRECPLPPPGRWVRGSNGAGALSASVHAKQQPGVE